MSQPNFLLIQVRNPDDPMGQHEVDCFAGALDVPNENIIPFDLLRSTFTEAHLNRVDAVLVGGSGDYSVVTGGTWLEPALQLFVWLYEQEIPVFASCWGFQAFARALGGAVVTDLSRAEVGTQTMNLTAAGTSDPVFAPLGDFFPAQIGHQDIVERLPSEAILLCSSETVTNQAMTFPGKKIYATQFHPELQLNDLICRLKAYPEYVEKITGLSMEQFTTSCLPSPQAFGILRRFKELI